MEISRLIARMQPQDHIGTSEIARRTGLTQRAIRYWMRHRIDPIPGRFNEPGWTKFKWTDALIDWMERHTVVVDSESPRVRGRKPKAAYENLPSHYYSLATGDPLDYDWHRRAGWKELLEGLAGSARDMEFALNKLRSRRLSTGQVGTLWQALRPLSDEISHVLNDYACRTLPNVS